MNAHKLVQMANQIADFFESDPDQSTTLAQIAGHLSRFWEPRLRRELLGWVDDHAGEGLKPTVLAAIAAHRDLLTPKTDGRGPLPSGPT